MKAKTALEALEHINGNPRRDGEDEADFSEAINTIQDFILSHSQEITEMALCESRHLCLRPNQLYRFIVFPECEECQTLAAIYNEGK